MLQAIKFLRMKQNPIYLQFPGELSLGELQKEVLHPKYFWNMNQFPTKKGINKIINKAIIKNELQHFL